MVKIKKMYGVIAIATILITFMCCGNAAANQNSVGPAPNSSDGDPDGSGFDQPNQQNEDSPGKGPAPNSSDGDPDGSGF